MKFLNSDIPNLASYFSPCRFHLVLNNTKVNRNAKCERLRNLREYTEGEKLQADQCRNFFMSKNSVKSYNTVSLGL